MAGNINFADFVEINPRVSLEEGAEYPFIEMEVVTPNRRYASHRQTRTYKNGGAKFRSGDTLFARITPCLENGKIAQFVAPKEQLAFGSTEFFVFRAKPGISDPAYVYYLASTGIIRKPAEKSMSGASGRQRADLNAVKNIQVPALDLEDQRKIASILSAYDDLIENNLRRIKILEEMAQNLYREWFVKFRFPGNEKVKMIDSDLGPIPVGWNIGTLKDIIDNCNDSTRLGRHLSDRYYVPIDLIPRRSLTLLETRSWEDARSSLHLFEEDDILFGAMRPYFHKVVIAPFRGVTRKTCFVLRPRYPELLSYALLTMFQDTCIQYANAHSKGSTIPYAAWEGSLADMKLIIPSRGIIATFNEIVSPILLNMKRAYPKLKNLRRTRDLLLPKLISGELDVSELDIDMGEKTK